MKYSVAQFLKVFVVISLFFTVLSSVIGVMPASAAHRDKYDIIYLLTKDLERVLDYKEELEAIFDSKVRRKLKVVGRGDEYALIYDGNDSARTVTKTLVRHAEILDKAGFDEPYATKEQNCHSLYNVSYGMGPNLEPLKKRYKIVYKYLGEDVKKDLFIEKTAYGNYTLIYRRRGTKSSTNRVAKKHARKLRSKRISTSLTRENNNTVVYGETSLMDDNRGMSRHGNITPTPVKTVAVAVLPRSIKTIKTVKQSRKIRSVPLANKYSKFEKSIEEYINKLRRKGKIAQDESTGWMVYDLKRDQSIIDINADQEFQAASMIKPFVALAFFHQAKAGKFVYGRKSRRKMEAMIQRSNNSATNWIMRQVGGPEKCEAILNKYYSYIFKKTKIQEYIPSNGRTYLNSSPPADYVRFLRALWRNKLPYGKEIRRLMALPGRDRLYHGTPIPRGTLVYNKTGTTAHLCGDMGILVPKTRRGGRYPYAIVGIIERRSKAPDYGQWMHSRSRVIREVSTMIYNEMKKEHQLL